MQTAASPTRPKLGATLERDRLLHRKRRLELVVRELRARADATRARSGRVPAPLGSALAEFQSELHAVRGRLGSRGPRRPSSG